MLVRSNIEALSNNVGVMHPRGAKGTHVSKAGNAPTSILEPRSFHKRELAHTHAHNTAMSPTHDEGYCYYSLDPPLREQEIAGSPFS